eukprot:31440-Pelagococcus_subviridis.AAC.27
MAPMLNAKNISRTAATGGENHRLWKKGDGETVPDNGDAPVPVMGTRARGWRSYTPRYRRLGP